MGEERGEFCPDSGRLISVSGYFYEDDFICEVLAHL